jgi:hypothetical protein
MNATKLATLSMSELKSICVDRAISVIGDKRLKASYINAVEGSDRHQEVSTPTAVSADPFDESVEISISAQIATPQNERCVTAANHSHPLAIEIESDVPSQLLSPHPHRNASIVLLVPLIIATALAVRTLY